MREDIFLVGPLIARGFQRYWRLTRGMKLAAEACVVDPAKQVLLVRSAGEERWNLPGGNVLNGEAMEAALRRSLQSIFGIEVDMQPELFWIYAERQDQQTGIFVVRQWRQTGLFVVRQWRQTGPSEGEQAFFPLHALPEKVEPQIVARISQVLEGRTPAEV